MFLNFIKFIFCLQSIENFVFYPYTIEYVSLSSLNLKNIFFFLFILKLLKKNSFLSLVLKLLKKKKTLYELFFFFQIWVTKIVFYPINKLGTFFGRLGQSNRNCINLQNEEISKHQNNNNWNKKLKIEYFHKDVIFVLIKKEGGKRNFNLVADFLLDLPVVDEEGS